MTNHETLHNAIIELPRNHFPCKGYRTQWLRNGKRYPVPYVAHQDTPDDQLRHASVHKDVFVRDDAGVLQVLCQMCGLKLDGNDTLFFLSTHSETSVRNTNVTISRHPDWKAKMDAFTDPDNKKGILLISNVGPCHPYCARMALRLCPEIKTSATDEIVGWIYTGTARSVLEDKNYWIGFRDDKHEYYNPDPTIMYLMPVENLDDMLTIPELEQLITDDHTRSVMSCD